MTSLFLSTPKLQNILFELDCSEGMNHGIVVVMNK